MVSVPFKTRVLVGDGQSNFQFILLGIFSKLTDLMTMFGLIGPHSNGM